MSIHRNETNLSVTKQPLKENRLFHLNNQHEKRCEPANLVCGQFLWISWIRPMSLKDLDKTNPHIDKNINR